MHPISASNMIVFLWNLEFNFRPFHHFTLFFEEIPDSLNCYGIVLIFGHIRKHFNIRHLRMSFGKFRTSRQIKCDWDNMRNTLPPSDM